ncbi:hypothetical protein ACP4OV_000142 [Aristida adscensionis]
MKPTVEHAPPLPSNTGQPIPRCDTPKSSLFFGRSRATKLEYTPSSAHHLSAQTSSPATAKCHFPKHISYPITVSCQAAQSIQNPNPRARSNRLPSNLQDALDPNRRRSRRAVSLAAAPGAMRCLLPLLLPAPRPRPCLTAPASRPPRCKDRFLPLPPGTRRRPRPRLGVRMAEMARVGGGAAASPEVAGVAGEGDAMLGGEEVSGTRAGAARWAPVEATLNRMSIWKHDAEIMWALLGAVANSLLSQILKKVLNHERPAPALRSDPGMPSSHAQSLFYAATILVLSLFYWLGTNYLMIILGPATLAMASYLSWLRVSQRLHTLNQIMVGAAVGSGFGALWCVLWHSLVEEAFASSLLIQVVVTLGSATFCVAFVIYMIRHWLKDE